MRVKSKTLKVIILLVVIAIITRDELAIHSNNYGITDIEYFGYSFQVSNAYDDGPYIFIEENTLREKRIVAGDVQEKELPRDSFRSEFSVDTAIVTTDAAIAALSDIHGQHDLFVQLLQNNGIINSEQNWAFGDGHFVITGDIFDRGEKVLDALWLVFKLEAQAAAAGGKVHYLLGNHEYMVLHGDLRYLHENHTKTAQLLETSYEKLFSSEAVLGRWLRSKSTVVKINSTVFLHGGLSMQFLDQGYSLDSANAMFRESVDLSKSEKRADPVLKEFYGSSGPIWYRGYFSKTMKESHVDSILACLNAEAIVVGHTSQKKIETLFNGKIYAIDSSIKRGAYGEILFIEKNKVFRGTLDGNKEPLN